MKHPSRATSAMRRTLFESDAIQIGSFEANPVSDACGDVEHQSLNAVVLPFAGVFSKHDAPGLHVLGTPSHAVFIAAETPYRIGLPGAMLVKNWYGPHTTSLLSNLSRFSGLGSPV
jgi:hypothetical protein